MDKVQASNIVKNTFEKPFDKTIFIGFVKNLLNQIEEAPFSYKGNYIHDSFKEYIASLERIGKYSDGEHKIDILIVQLKKETSIERARTMQRNYIAKYLNGSRGGEMKDAALVAFVSPNTEDWRFSLVKMDYKFEKNVKGKIKVKEEFTPARRWSFLVGTHENSHTAQSRLVPLISDDTHNPTLAELEESFNIEKVTKEFFEKYRELFLRTKEELDKFIKNDSVIKTDFEKKDVNTVDFSKKLLGQIVFLYFLQKKGWFGVQRDSEWGTGSKQFLRELFEKKHGSYNNFFNDILEPLFYEALRIDRSHDDHYYSRFNCKIPFLNGGLFDPMNGYDWVRTDILIPNELFSNSKKTKEGDTGDGILDIFDRYNFTVKEDEPLEKEVAIDPELLGKAYEKFNAIRPDNYAEFKKALKSGKKGDESKFNKQYGVYYTPREIVHYMCQQSLINYLYTELNDGIITYEKLGDDQTNMFGNEGKTGQLDLTIKHNSKPIIPKEDFETLVHFAEHVSENEAHVEKTGRETATYYYKIPDSIRNNAERIDEKLANIKVCDPAIGSGAFPVGMMSEIVRARTALTPFIKDKDRTVYHFKRECIENSLYGVDIDLGAVEIAKLRLWLSLVVDEDDIKQIKPLPNLDYKIVCGNSLLGVEKNIFNSGLFDELEKIKPQYFNETNPSKKQEYKKQIDGLISKITNGHSEFDFEVYFSEVFHNDSGFNVTIANPPYIRIHKQDEKYKKVFKDKYYSAYKDYDIYVLFFEKSLSILRTNGILTFITPDKYLVREYGLKIREIFSKYSFIELFDLSRANDIFEAATYPLITIIQKNIHNKFIVTKFANTIKNINSDYSLTQIKQNKTDNFLIEIINPSDQLIVNKIYQNSSPLSDIIKKEQIFCGTPRAVDYHSWENYITDKPSKNSLKVIVCGHITPYFIDHKKKVRTVGKNIEEPYFNYKKDSMSLSRWEDFKVHPKILIRGNDTRLTAAIDFEGSVFIGVYAISIENYSLEDYYLLLSLLNSNLYQWLFKVLNPSIKVAGGYFSINSPQIFRLPMKKNIPESIRQDLINNVKNIISLTKSNTFINNKNQQDKFDKYINNIDQIVYKLYNISKEEIFIMNDN